MKAATAVVGAGAWGTALALTLSRSGDPVRLWVYEAELAAAMQRERENRVYLPGFTLPENIAVSSKFEATLVDAAGRGHEQSGPSLPSAQRERPQRKVAVPRPGCDLVIIAVPSHGLRAVLTQMAPHLLESTALLLATKGLEPGTLMRVSEVAASVLGPACVPRLATLSGPTFAREIAAGEPAAVVIAAQHAPTARRLQTRLASPTLRLYTSADVIGVELGAALKNVIAIASGICQGLGLGSNTRAALIARGLAEMSRLAVAAGGEAETLAGLAGLGDLVLTCTGELSRNRALGIGLGQGRTLAELQASTPTVAEGVTTTPAALELAQRLGVELPITAQMHRVLFAGASPAQALAALMQRPLTRE